MTILQKLHNKNLTMSRYATQGDNVNLKSINSDATKMAEAIESASGIKNISGGSVIDYFPIPTSFSVKVTSNNEASAADVTMYLFNEQYLTTSPTTNGSGAASIVKTYADGYSGKIYEQYTKVANGGRGIKFNGFTLQVTNYTTGAQTAAYFNTLSMNVKIANGMQGLIPYNVDIIEALRNTQQQVGILTATKPLFLNALGQITYIQPYNTIFNWTFFTNASSFFG